MKMAKKISSFFLAVVLAAASILPAAAFEKPENAETALQGGYASSQDKYAIYPIPQSAVYPGGKFALGTNVQVVSESGIDEYTNAFLAEILEDYGRTKTESSTVGSGQKILLGIKGSGGAVDTWTDSNVEISKADLFQQTDSYLLSAKDGTIVILGQDTDAVYYGLATLQMMFSSFAGSRFLNVQIEDYATMKTRGFIEGFYGAWNYEGRESVMWSERDVKMNSYIYASKDDHYHKSDDLYPTTPDEGQSEEDLEINKIRKLVEVGEKTKVRYGWSIHLSYFFGGLGTVGTSTYETNFNAKAERLKAKFQQLYDVGVRKFAILNDDFGSGEFDQIVRLLNKIDDEFIKEKGDCESLIYCMKGYNKSWAAGGYGGGGRELESLKSLNYSIDLFWTGDDVNSPITQDTVDHVRNATDGHNVVFWLNYPVNEHAASGLFLGNISHYARDNVTGLTGLMSNPCRYTEANKVGFFQLACLSWNNADFLENLDMIWRDSFKYLQPEVYDAYLTIGKHVANCPDSSRVSGFPESEDIKEDLEAVQAKILNGETVSGDAGAQRVKEEFSKIKAAVETFRSKCTNKVLVENITPWLNSLYDVATAGEAVMEAVFAMEKTDVDGVWQGVAAAGKAMATQATYSPYPGANKMARAGSRRLVPFINKIVPIAKRWVMPHLDPSAVMISFYGRIAGKEVDDTSETAKIFDGDVTTSCTWQSVHQIDDYVGIDMGRVVPVHSIEIYQAANDNGVANQVDNYFHHAALEYSEDGSDGSWIQIGENYEFQRHISEKVEIEARYIRLRATAVGRPGKPDHWTTIREITINGGTQEKFGVCSNVDAAVGEVSHQEGTYSLAADGTVSLKAGEYLGIKFEELSELKRVNVDCPSGLVLQYSENGVIWENMPVSLGGEAARYVRLYNGSAQAVSFTVNNFSVAAEGSTGLNPTVETSLGLKDGSWENLFDGKLSTYAWTNSNQTAGDSIIVDLGAEMPVSEFTITTGDDRPKLYNAQVKVSSDKNNWTQVAEIYEEGDSVVGDIETEGGIYRNIKVNMGEQPIRYIQILVTKNKEAYLKILDIDIKAIEKGSMVFDGTLTGELDNMIDGDVSTIYMSDKLSDGTDYVKYKLTENTKITSVAFLQNGANITNALVEAEIYDGNAVRTETLGKLDRGNTVFYRKGDEEILSFTITWPEGTCPALYEIIPSVGEKVHEIHLENDGETKSIYCADRRILVLPQDTYQKEGYILRGWSDGAKTYAAGTYYEMGTADVTLTAVWEKLQKVSFVSEGSQTENEYYEPGSIIVLPEKKREGYIFKGWNDGSKVYAQGESYTVGSADVTLTAVWEKKPSSGENPGGNKNPTPVPTPQPTAPGAPSGLKATKNANTSVSLSWNSVAEANGYIVSMYDTNAKAWKDVSLVGGTSYQVKGLKSATEYQFRVKAYKNHSGSRIAGADSSILKTATSPVKTKLKVKKAGKSKVKLTWNKKAKADGFEIFMKMGKKGKFKRIASKKKNVVSMTKKGMKKGKTYTFRLRSYKKSGGQKIYSAYTTKKIKIK